MTNLFWQNSVIIFLSQMTLLRCLTVLLVSLTMTLTALFSWIYLFLLMLIFFFYGFRFQSCSCLIIAYDYSCANSCVQRCCVLQMIKENCLLKFFLRTLVISLPVFLLENKISSNKYHSWALWYLLGGILFSRMLEGLISGPCI